MLILFYALSEVAESFLVPAVEVRACITPATFTWQGASSQFVLTACFDKALGTGTLMYCSFLLHKTRSGTAICCYLLVFVRIVVHNLALAPILVCVLQWISETMKLPPAVAGVTLLSFAGGAPDLFTQLAAVCTGQTQRPVTSALLSSPSPAA